MPLKMPEVKLSRRSKITIGILITLSTAAMIVLFFHLTWSGMFSRNNRFTLTRLLVGSANGRGWWDGKSDEIARYLAPTGKPNEPKVFLARGRTNLFVIDPGEIRSRLEKIPEIEKASVRRILPDTLEIKLTERIPCAVLGNRGSYNLIAPDGVVLRRSHCLNLAGTLPIIYGFRNPVPGSGERFSETEGAISFIKLTETAYSEIRIVLADVSMRDCVKLTVYFRNRPADSYLITVPVKNPELGLDRILASIANIKQNGAPSREIDLRFENRTVLKPAPAEKQ